MSYRSLLEKLRKATACLIHAALVLVLAMYLIFIVRAYESVFLPSDISPEKTYLFYCWVFPLLLASLYFRLIIRHKGRVLLKEVLFVGIGISLLLTLLTAYVLANLV